MLVTTLLGTWAKDKDLFLLNCDDQLSQEQMKFHQNVKTKVLSGEPSFLTFAVCQEGAKTAKRFAALSQRYCEKHR